MKVSDIIIIGAGAAGLMAAYILSKAGKTVTVLEARNRIGGRIHTVYDKDFSTPVELGAEFVHGDLPITLNLLKEADIFTDDVQFEMWQHHDNSFSKSQEFVEGWDNFLEKVNHLKHDMPLYDFLEQYFAADNYTRMRSQIESYVAGYDTADILDVSTFALRNEWNHEEEDAQHRVNGGYSGMADYLANTVRDQGNTIQLNTVAKEILWKKDKVEIITTNNTVYEADKVIIALPLGVLHANKEEQGAIVFNPYLAEQSKALKNICFGSIIKVLLEFDEIFWESDTITELAGADLSTMGFLFSDEVIPTFWTQAPTHSPLLTGWLGGPPAYQKKDLSQEAILELTLISLSNIFKISPEVLTKKIVAWRVANWTSDPYTRGSYAYEKVESTQARKVLNHPLEDTIYFAGEYLYEGPAMGTVEAALNIGKNVADRILKK